MAKRKRAKKGIEFVIESEGLGSFYNFIAKYTHKYAFKLGIALALVLGLASSVLGEITKGWIFTILALCGILGGFFNISAQERKDFLVTSLVAVLVLTVGGAVSFSEMLYLGSYVMGVINALLVFIIPATFVAAVKHLFDLLGA